MKFYSLLFLAWLFVLPAHAATTAPPLQATSLDGKAIDLNDYQGKVVYLDFWASWCPPCAKSFPQLNQLYKELKDQGFAIVAISVDKEKSDLEQFLQKIPVDFDVAWDASGVSPERYQVQTMPSGYLIDQQGNLHKRFNGFKNGHIEKIKQQVLQLLQTSRDEP